MRQPKEQLTINDRVFYFERISNTPVIDSQHFSRPFDGKYAIYSTQNKIERAQVIIYVKDYSRPVHGTTPDYVEYDGKRISII